MKFITVHQNGEEILVNTDHIIKVEQKKESKGEGESKYTVLHLTDSTHQATYSPTPLMRVSESFEEIKKLLA
ncbi:MAG: hypothetical protein K2X77_27200 [Candidatus Obscuribacterales bacterium]|jgi:hypothetical protein|nr:hypothetical protein [Candidatus Obscuribacterales bacterium]